MDDYQRAEEENRRNPKNRFLGLFCHASEVDNSWGCNLSFGTGVIIFSIIIGIAAGFDIYFIAKNKIYSSGAYTGSVFKFFMSLKVLADIVVCFAIITGCYSVHAQNLKFSIISYYLAILSFIFGTIFLISSFYYMFKYYNYVLIYIIPWGIYEFAMVLFCWILFCNQVYLGRVQRAQANQTSL